MDEGRPFFDLLAQEAHLATTPQGGSAMSINTESHSASFDPPSAHDCESPSLEETADLERLDDLRALATPVLSANQPSDDSFYMLYGSGHLPALAPAPLPEQLPHRRSRRPHRPVVPLAALLSLAVVAASAWALEGFTDAPTRAPEPLVIELAQESFAPTRGLSSRVSVESSEPVAEVVAERPTRLGAVRRPPRPNQRLTARRDTVAPPTRSLSVGSGTSALSARHAANAGVPDHPDVESERISRMIDDVFAETLDSPDPILPASPTRAQVSSSLRAVAAAVGFCGTGERSTVRVNLSINGPTGRVRWVRVSGAKSARESSCIQRAVSSAVFPLFADPSFVVANYPYIVR